MGNPNLITEIQAHFNERLKDHQEKQAPIAPQPPVEKIPDPETPTQNKLDLEDLLHDLGREYRTKVVPILDDNEANLNYLIPAMEAALEKLGQTGSVRDSDAVERAYMVFRLQQLILKKTEPIDPFTLV